MPCWLPRSYMLEPASHLGSIQQELNKGNAQLVREPYYLSGQALSASSGKVDANGAVCHGAAPEEGFKPGRMSREFP